MGAGDHEQLGLDLLDPAFSAPALHRVTPARLAAWASCPRRYRLLYLDRPAPPRGGAWAHTTLGAVVHLALRSLFELVPSRRSPELAAQLVDRNWSDEGFRDAAQSADYRARARDWVAAIAAGPDGRTEPVALERGVREPVGTMLVEGRIDRVDVRDGESVVVDYKTGNVPTPERARDSQALALYALAAGPALRRPCHRVELHHVPTGEVAAWEHDDASLRGHRERAEHQAAEMAAAADALGDGGDPDVLFGVVTGTHCGTCPVRRNCAQGRAATPEPASWALLPS
ncbi:RecB family exonuclease [Pseudonocardia endophytica]|uniref:PD-(D/E)XK nuclease superfamily protein n=1 Tax=Pseudonocardia endophytica TaxID=401976 RepID=A0A4R1I1Y0_PSEEN|nr:PD-(D/E)XK nuclease family protein [Pseudonocardia endophytica]TCK26479.1 PD-(D/E)XK nuclease superfamily protein [Pseudonocardia endophytica]